MSSFCHTQHEAAVREEKLLKKKREQIAKRDRRTRAKVQIEQSVADISVHSNIDRFKKEVISDNIDPPLPYQQRVLQKALCEREEGRFDDDFKYSKNKPKKGVNDCSMTLFLERTHQVGLNSRQEEWSDNSMKQPRRIEMQGMNQNQVLDRIKHDPYFIRRQMHSQKFPEGCTWNNEDRKYGPKFSRGPVDPLTFVANK